MCECVFVCFSPLASYGVDLVARQQLASALEWTVLKEKEFKEVVGEVEPVGSDLLTEPDVN